MTHPCRWLAVLASLFFLLSCNSQTAPEKVFPKVTDKHVKGYFPLASKGKTASIFYDDADFKVVEITAQMLSDDIERVTGSKPSVTGVSGIDQIDADASVVAGTVGRSRLIDELIERNLLSVDEIAGKWESSIVTTITHPATKKPLLVIAGSDRRGTAFGLTSLSRAIGVSPWYWWADVTPRTKDRLFVQNGRFHQPEPCVQYRGIFINDERFGGWARWVEQTFDKETGQVGPKVYEKVFELLLRLRGNYLWPAMHNGSKAFNMNPENARLADDYAIVMGSSHCEQMLRNNEDEWKNVGTYGDFNYITNRKTMQDYWETRVRENGMYENTYTLGLRGIHDYPMEGANTTEQRMQLMQQAINDQRDILRRNVDKPLEEIPQILCTYEEVLDAYHAGLQVPEEVIMLWSDDKQGYTRNLSNPQEMKRKGGAGIYYHLSYHGDPASWIWLSPLSPAFISTELTKAYTYGAQKVWIFNVGDIKPAEKEITFSMDLAWDIEKWAPQNASGYIRQWAAETFGQEFADEIASMQAIYYRLMASGKDSHIWFVEYPEKEIFSRIEEWRSVAERAELLENSIPEQLKAAYFELVLYPIKGAQMLNEYQLMSRLSQSHATWGKDVEALAEGERATEMFNALNDWTVRYNDRLLDGKWAHFFNWVPYHWYGSKRMDAPVATQQTLDAIHNSPSPQSISVSDATSAGGVTIVADRDGEIDIWMKALTPVQNFSKAPKDNIFCHVDCGKSCFDASATPINNVWHSPHIGPMWSKVGRIYLEKGENKLKITQVKDDARIDQIFIGTYPPLPDSPASIIPASKYVRKHDADGFNISTISQLGFSDGVTVLPFDSPSYDTASAPYVEFDVELSGNRSIEVRTLPTLHVYEGRDARYAVSIDGQPAQVFSIHEGDFTAGWRLNVLRGYATRSIDVSSIGSGSHSLRISMLDPGIVLQEIRIY